MATIILGQHPDALEVRLTRGDSATLVATLTDSTGTVTNWTAAPTLEFADGRTKEPIVAHTATTAGEHATWTLSATQVETIATASPLRYGTLHTFARITLPDTDDTTGSVEYTGKVSWSDGWTAGDRSQRVTFTVAGPKGDPGESGGNTMTVVSGGTVDLDNTLPNGTLIGYRVTATTTIEGGVFAPDSYIFERDTTSPTGWTYRTLAAAAVVNPPDTTAPTAPTLSVNNSAETQLVATFSGGTDDTAVTQYRTRINGGAWTVGASPRTFTGLTASTSYTIDAQAGDAAGNWSPSATWTGSTAAIDPAPGWTVYDSFTAADGTALNGRTTVKGAKAWVSPHSWDGGGVPEAASITGNLVANTNTGGLSTQGARINWGAGNVEVECDYDVSSGVDTSGNKQVIITVASASGNDFLAFQVRANGALVCLKGGAVEPTMTGVVAGLPTTGTINVKLIGNTVTVTHPAGTASVTVAPGASPGWTNTGTFCGVSARSRTAKFDNLKVRVPA